MKTNNKIHLKTNQKRKNVIIDRVLLVFIIVVIILIVAYTLTY